MLRYFTGQMVLPDGDDANDTIHGTYMCVVKVIDASLSFMISLLIGALQQGLESK